MSNSYAERQGDSYDDSLEINRLRNLCRHDDTMRSYLKQYMNFEGNVQFVDHPAGDYGIDVVLVDRQTNEVLINIDVEKWSNFNIQSFTLFQRKEKYLSQKTPFVLIVFNQDHSKWLAIDKDTILQFPFSGSKRSFGGKNAFGGFSSAGRRIPRNAAFEAAL